MTPCVVLITHVDELFAHAGHGAPGGDKGGGFGSEDVVAEVIRAFLEGHVHHKSSTDALGTTVAVVGTSDVALNETPEALRRCFTHDIALSPPRTELRLELLRQATACARLDGEAERALGRIAQQSAGRGASDLEALVNEAARRSSLRGYAGPRKGLAQVTSEDLELTLSSMRPSGKGSLATLKIPEVRWEDVGGLAHIRKEIVDVIELPLKRPDLFKSGARRRSGVLLFGPPGTGKTLIAKAVATECRLSFMSVKGPELLDMYIGESEKNVRFVFAAAREAAPCVIFFDELDSLAPARGRGSDSGGVMDRVVSQLLTELDGLAAGGGGGGGPVFVIGATNRPDLLDQSLLRPGRFDRLLYLGIDGGADARLRVLEAVTRQFDLSLDVDLEGVAAQIPKTFTGADTSAVASEALSRALRRRISELERELTAANAGGEKPGEAGAAGGAGGRLTMDQLLANYEEENPAQLRACVSMDDLLEATGSILPSVSSKELAHYEQLRLRFCSTAH